MVLINCKKCSIKISDQALSCPHCNRQVNDKTLLKDKNIVSSSASVLCLTGHKEDLLARKAALELARMLGHTVTVTVGLHIDDASAEAIAMLEANFQELLRQICLWAAA